MEIQSMKYFSFYINMILICSILFLCLPAMYTDSLCITAAPTETSLSSPHYEGNELVLLWNRPVDHAICDSFLADFPNCDILESLDNYMLVSVRDSGLFWQTLASLRSLPGVLAADPNFPLELSSPVFPSDPAAFPLELYEETFASAVSAGLSQGIALYQDSIIPAKEVIVAIADTGIDTTHPALADFIWTNPSELPGDGIDNDDNGYIDDVHGWDFYHDDATVCHYLLSEDGLTYQALPEDNDTHGTHVAGIIASVLRGGDLHATDTPPAPVKLMPLKIHGGEKSSGSVAHAIKAIKYAVMMDADICNISWGSAAITSSITTLEQTIRESDLLFITAAGNAGSDNDQVPVYPAAFRLSNVLSITFVDHHGRLTPRSNYGATTVDLAAPGTDIYSTAVGADYAYMSGSSMAVPYVSAIAALLYTTADGLYPSTVRDLILSTAYPLPDSQSVSNASSDEVPEPAFENIPLLVPGVPDLYRALNSLHCLSTDTTAPVLSTSIRHSRDFIYLDVNADDAEGSGIRLVKYAKGSKNLTAFRRGTQGTTLPASGLRSAKPGNYTLYVSDYAGNDTILRVKLSDDTTPPEILYTLHTSPSGRLYQLTVDIHDESSLDTVCLLSGAHETVTVLPQDAVVLSLINGHANLRLREPGPYSLYAQDIKGNTSVTILELPTTSSTNSEVSDIE